MVLGTDKSMLACTVLQASGNGRWVEDHLRNILVKLLKNL